MNKTFIACMMLFLFLGLDVGYMVHDAITTPVQPQTITTTRTIVQTSTETAYEVISPFLHVHGTQIVDANGTTINLHGANFMGYEFCSMESHTLDDYKNIASMGFNVVRLPISWECLEPVQGHYDDEYLKYVDRDMAWAKSLRLYVVVDMHQYFWSNTFLTGDGGRGGGMPEWTTRGYDPGYYGMQSAVTNFWSNQTLLSGFMRAWQRVAVRYRNETALAGYDILNEPLSGKIPVYKFSDTVLPQFYDEAIAAIKQVDPNHIFFYEASLDAIYLPVKVNAPNVVFSPHFYYFAFSNGYDRQKMLPIMKGIIINQLANVTVPVWVGEFGIDAGKPNYKEWITDARRIFAEHHIGWAWWAYWKDDDPSMALATSKGTLKPVLVALLTNSDESQ